MPAMMFGILISAGNALLAFLLRSVLAKFFVFFALWFITTEFLQYLGSSGLFPTASSINGAFSGLPPGVAFFVDVFAFSTGAGMLISAYVTRFIIRRIPLIG